MIATIAVIAEKKKTSAIAAIIAIIWNHSPAIAATTISVIVVAAIAEEWFAELFFLGGRSDHSDRSDHMETGLNLSQ